MRPQLRVSRSHPFLLYLLPVTRSTIVVVDRFNPAVGVTAVFLGVGGVDLGDGVMVIGNDAGQGWLRCLWWGFGGIALVWRKKAD